ncbi:MAG: helix-turn-helix domain-containing protein [Nitrospira sp.]|nr:helix-turn-helix domain-containing protein [Nitrospira sp.]
MTLLLQDLERKVDELPREQMPNVIGLLSILSARAQMRIMQPEAAPLSLPDDGPYLNVDEVATRFHVTPTWLYRHKKDMPHSQPSRKILLFPEQAITKWFASRKAA